MLALEIRSNITASINMKVMQRDVVSKFAEWKSQGEMGRKKIAQVTRYGTVGLSLVQATAMSIGFNAMTEGMLIEDPNALKIIIIALVLTSGTAFLMW